MPYLTVDVSSYQAMWLVVMFDLPVKTKGERRRYAQFRNLLLEQGFSILQLSVYARPFLSEEASEPCRQLLTRELPTKGHVRLLMVTDRQYGKMKSFYGKKEAPLEEPLRQTLLF